MLPPTDVVISGMNLIQKRLYKFNGRVDKFLNGNYLIW